MRSACPSDAAVGIGQPYDPATGTVSSAAIMRIRSARGANVSSTRNVDESIHGPVREHEYRRLQHRQLRSSQGRLHRRPADLDAEFRRTTHRLPAGAAETPAWGTIGNAQSCAHYNHTLAVINQGSG